MGLNSESGQEEYHHQVVMFLLPVIFAVIHSGLINLKEPVKKVLGERGFDLVFFGTSFPLVGSIFVYFVIHRYDGVQLWQLQSVPFLHPLVWANNFLSAFFFYPSTFNFDKPKKQIWESGMMRITRHPQLVGQTLWSVGHTVWIGNSVAVLASIGLVGYQVFGAWMGERKLARSYGEAFEAVKSRTSVVPFAAILEGRQKPPKDFHKELMKMPLLTVAGIAVGVYSAHPLLKAAGAYCEKKQTKWRRC